MNSLLNEKSPYLVQHASNPVDWRPWSAEATGRAKKENRPLLISIGYSTCHWCHVMAKESFEDKETAAIMNEHFVNIKIDREEHPDIDSLYMKAVQALTGQGGWPLTVFATPDGVPFYGGTYFPPVSTHGMPSFKNVLATVITAYSENRAGLNHVTRQIIGALSPVAEEVKTPLSAAIVKTAIANAAKHHDKVNGGFGNGMKFPHTIFLKFLLKHHLAASLNSPGPPDPAAKAEILGIVKRSLSAMASGGLYDAIGGGFHRYTVDEQWDVPHFEKMLYDNGQLIGLYALGYEATGLKLYADAAENTADYLIREMLSPEGGFYAAEDADSGGVEGTYYVWRPETVRAVLNAEDARRFIEYYSITEHGNFDGANTLRARQKEPDEAIAPDIAALHAPLLAARAKRTPPAKDKKIIVAWNGLVIEAFATASTLLNRPDLLDRAATCADFLLNSLKDPARRLRRYYLGEMSKAKAGLADYALLGTALIALHTAERIQAAGKTQPDSGNNRAEPAKWLNEAKRLATEMVALFYDRKSNRFFDSADDSEPLFVRPRDLFDNDLPSGNAGAADFLLHLGKELQKSGVTDEPAKEYMDMAVEILHTSTGIIDYPLYHGSMLSVLDTLIKENGTGGVIT